MKRVTSVIFQIVIAIFAVFVIFGLSYVIGREYLIGNNLLGNDSYSFYVLTLWVAKYFPNVPFWYPIAGGGVSLVSAYPTFASFLVVLITKLSSLDVTQAFRLLGFSSVPLFSVGIFVFCWLRIKSIESPFVRQGIGFVSAIFAVASPASWIWLTRWGFYAESISMIFVPWVILFFDIFLEKLEEGKKDFAYRASILGVCVFMALAFITHMLAAGCLALFFAIWVFIVFLRSKEKKVFVSRLIPGGIVLLISFTSLIAFRLFSYQFYMNQVAKGGFSGYGAPAYSEAANNTLPLPMALSLTRPDTIADPHALIFDTRFNLYVWILFGLGLILSFRMDKKIFAFGVYAVLGLIFTNVLPVRFWLNQIPFISSIVNFMQYRGYLIIAKIAVTIVAGYGAFGLWNYLLKFKPKFISGILVLLLGLSTVGVLVFSLYQKPYNVWFLVGTGVDDGVLDLRDVWNIKPYKSTVSYGDEFRYLKDNSSFWSANLLYMRQICLERPMDTIAPGSICDYYLKDKQLDYPPKDVFLRAEKDCMTSEEDFCDAFYSSLSDQLKPSSWPKFEISSSVSQKVHEVEDNLKDLPLGDHFRFDMSGYAGSVIMSTPLVTSNSQIQLYINTSSLIYNSWNYLSQVMYSNAPVYQKPGVLTELARWFGLKYIFLKGNELEPLSFWKTDDNWSDLGTWKEFNQDISLVDWTDKSKVLVIADEKRGIYDQAFRFFNWGGIPFEQGLTVIGGKNVDDYSLNELRGYDLIVMVGYKYKNKNRAYSLLDGYVKNGGKLIFDTGWQYEIPDYVISKAPEFMPFESLTWKNLDVGGNFDQNSFGPLTYGDSSWGVSTPGKVKSWAKPILSFNGTPLGLKGEYGKGEVVWFGFNIIPHAIAKDNLNEALFFGSVVKELIGDSNSQKLNVSMNRVSPDKVEFVLNQDLQAKSEIYFKESHFPYWKATLVRGSKTISDLKVERSGPGFMLIDLSDVLKGDKVVLQIKVSFIQRLMDGVSVLTFIILVLYVVEPRIFAKIRFPKVKIGVKLPKLGKIDDEDKNY